MSEGSGPEDPGSASAGDYSFCTCAHVEVQIIDMRVSRDLGELGPVDSGSRDSGC